VLRPVVQAGMLAGLPAARGAFGAGARAVREIIQRDNLPAPGRIGERGSQDGLSLG